MTVSKSSQHSDSIVLSLLLGKPEAEHCYPFGDDVSVFKVRGKMYATHAHNFRGEEAINLKCEPSQALALRDVFDAVVPGYHMNKKHWNTVMLNGDVPLPEVERMIDHSYSLVVKGLKKAERQALVALYGEHILSSV